MKLTVQEITKDKEEELIALCYDQDENWIKNVRAVINDGFCINGKADGDIFSVNIKNIYYFESVDNHSFFYTKDKVFECKLKVYEFEELTKDFKFFKASKSTIVNIKKIRCVKPSVSGRFEVTLLNDYKLLVSRLYVRALKTIMGL